MTDALASVSAHRGIRGSHDERRLTTRWPTTTKPAPEAATAAPPPIKIKGRVLAEFADYDGLWSSVRVRADELELTRAELDYQSGLQEGYSAKVLGPSKIKKFGTLSLGGILGALGCRLVLIEDAAATAEIMKRCKKRRMPLQRPKLLPAPSQTRP
jgi:hypothetical protein